MPTSSPSGSFERPLFAIPDTGPDEIHASDTVGEAGASVLRRQARILVSLESAVRADADPDAVHDARVAIRRARTAMRLFRDALPDELDPARAGLAWLGRSLGEVRDVDVLRVRVSRWTDAAGPEDVQVLQAIDVLLIERRTSAHRRLIRTLDSPRYGDLRRFLVEQIIRPSLPGGVPIVAVAPTLVAGRYRAVRKAGDRLDRRSSAEDLHALRIRGKRLRYAVEFVEPLYGAPARSLIGRLKVLQDFLGELQDMHLAIGWLRGAAADSTVRLPQESSFVMGSIAERERRRSVKLRRRIPRAYEGILGPRWKDLKRSMRQAARS